MSFDALETSRKLGKPIHLFTFTRQGLSWRFCNGMSPFTYGAFTWLPAQISRSEIKDTAEAAKDKITIAFPYLRDPVTAATTAPATQGLGDNWFPYPPHDTVFVSCLAAHVGDASAPAPEWIGIITQTRFGDGQLQLTSEPDGGISRAGEQGFRFQRNCGKSVYSTGIRGCNLDPEPLAVAAELTDVAGLTISADEFSGSALNLAGGWIEWDRGDGLIERRSIMTHAGNNLTLLYGADLVVDQEVTAYPGCPQNWAACVARDNTENYGGAIYMPVDDPMKESMSWG